MRPPLDDAQAQIAKADPDSRTSVFAGPGAGKSHVVGELAKNLIREHGLWPDEILVISFSRAAVRVVRERTLGLSEEGISVTASTLDALAAQILRASDPDTTSRGYDRAIELATDTLRRDDSMDVLDAYQHVIIDEVQDVVGVRAEFAFEVLAAAVRNGAGFTLLGDRHQSLYDFQVTQRHNWSSDTFLAKVDESFAPNHVQLRHDYRSKTRDAGRVAEVGQELDALDVDQGLRRMRAVSADLAPLGALDEDAVHTVSNWRGSTAFLCDTNARAGLVVDQLTRAGLTSVQLPAATEAPIPAWVGQVLENTEGSRVTRESFLVAAEEVVPDPEESWRLLQTISDSDRLLDVEKLASRITARDFEPRQLCADSIVVSTVHRAKGLEFENVVLVDPEDWRTDDEDLSRTTRMLYVALSRAHSRVTSVTGCSTLGWFKVSVSEDRQMWVRGPRGRRGGINALLLEPSFATPLTPTARLTDDWVGQPVSWSRMADVQDAAGEAIPAWTATVDDVAIAQTDQNFGRFVARRGRGTVPDLAGGRVEGLVTAVTVGPSPGSGRPRLSLGARVSGVVDLKWR